MLLKRFPPYTHYVMYILLCMSHSVSGDIGRVKEILLNDDTMKDFCLPQDGATPLMYAAMSGRIDIAMLLVENECDIDKQDKISNWTALMQAIFHGLVYQYDSRLLLYCVSMRR